MTVRATNVVYQNEPVSLFIAKICSDSNYSVGGYSKLKKREVIPFKFDFEGLSCRPGYQVQLLCVHDGGNEDWRSRFCK